MAEYLKIPEVARRLDVSEKTARRYVKAGVLPSTFIGGSYRVTEEDLEEFVHRAAVKPQDASPKVESSSPEPSFEHVLDDEQHAAWKVAVVEGRQLRETGTARMWKALSEWSASKQRGEPYTARREYLDAMGNLLQEVYDAEGALGRAYLEAALTQGGSEAEVPSYLGEKSRTMGHFYGELFGLVKSAGLSIRTDAGAKVQPETTPHSVEDPDAA